MASALVAMASALIEKFYLRFFPRVVCSFFPFVLSLAGQSVILLIGRRRTLVHVASAMGPLSGH